MLPEISETEFLQLAVEDGERAKLAKPFIEEYARRVIASCCKEFTELEINYYQNLDSKRIFMLQLQMKMAKDLLSTMNRVILEGDEANKTINERI